MVDTILLSGVYSEFDGYRQTDILKRKGKNIDPKKLYIRKDFDSAEMFVPFPVNVQDEESVFTETDSCTSVTLMSILERNGLSFVWNNLALFSNETGKKSIAVSLQTDAPTVSLSTTFILSEKELDNVIQFIREHAPGKKIILGGPLVELNPEYTAKADYAVIGEGEYTYPALLRAILENRPLDDIQGVAYRREDDSVVMTEPAPYLDLDACPPVNWNLARYEGAKTVPYEASRSCPFKCKFCTYHLRGKFRFKSAKKIFEEWKYFVEECGAKHISVFDSVFSAPKERLKELCELIIREKLAVSWDCWVRATDMQDQEITDLMAKAGCKTVAFGLESASDEILQNMNKRVTVQQIENAVNHLTASKIMILAHLIVGFPGETVETVRSTTDFLIRSKIPMYNSLAFRIREVKLPILEPEEKEKFGIKVGDECDFIPESYSDDYGEYWTTNTMTLMEAIQLNKAMMKEVALKGRALCANLIDINKARKLLFVLNSRFVYQALKMFEKIMVLSMEETVPEEELENAWEEFLTHYAILTD